MITTIGEHRWGAGQSSSDAFVRDLGRMINRNFFVGVCRVAGSENRAICFGDLIPADCVLCRLAEELFAFASLAINTWRLLKGFMASEGSSWPEVRSEELPEGLSDREDEGRSTEETPSVSGLSKGGEPRKHWIARSYLSKVQDEDGLKKYRDRYQIPSDVILRIPDSDEVACLSRYDDVAFYEADFNAGLRFTMQPLIRELLDHLNLAPAQLAPNAWRTVVACMVMWKVCSEGSDDLTLDELLFCYKPCQIAISSGFWTLSARQRRLKLVVGIPSSNREWKDDYVFVCGDNWEGLPWERDDDFIGVRREWGVPSSSALKWPGLSSDGHNMVLRALHHREHHFKHFIRPDFLALYSFGPEPSEAVLSLQEINQKRMATTKLNKERLKKMMSQQDEAPVTLGKRRKVDSSSQKVVDERTLPPPPAPKPILLDPVPTSSVEVFEVSNTPSSSIPVEKVPTLPKDGSLAMRRAKTVVLKDDVGEYDKVNTDVVRMAAVHSLMKGLTEVTVLSSRCSQWDEALLKQKVQLSESAQANQRLTTLVNELTLDRDRVVGELSSFKVNMATKDEELRKALGESRKANERLQALTSQIETIKASAVEEFKMSEAYDDVITKYFLSGFNLLKKQAKEKYPALDFEAFKPYDDDEFVMPADDENAGTASADPQVDDDATS
uniref:Uncharacterized protein n=1 Tax=Fagus sylvatica TaxID=28930 RepID=A0A2N9ECM7_FAGSY